MEQHARGLSGYCPIDYRFQIDTTQPQLVSDEVDNCYTSPRDFIGAFISKTANAVLRQWNRISNDCWACERESLALLFTAFQRINTSANIVCF